MKALFARMLLGGATSAAGAPIWLWLVGGLLVALMGLEGARRVQTSELRAALATEQVQRAQERQAYAEAAKDAVVKYREIENERAVMAQRIADYEAKEKAATQAGLDRGRAADRGLRDTIATFAAGGGGPASDPAVVRELGERAATLGVLLATCRAEATEDAGELEGYGTQVRGLLRRYDSLITTSDAIDRGSSP